MRKSVIINFRWICVALLFCLAPRPFVRAQEINDAGRLMELRRLRDQLQLGNALRGADVLVVMNERVVNEAARQLIGLEIVLSNGSTIRVSSIEIELRTAAAFVRVGLQARSSITVNLQLLGRINSGELEKDALRLPIRVTDVKLGNGFLSSVLVRTLLGEWLKPETWNDELPAIELPLEIAEALEIPASRFDVAGEMPMEISTPAFQAPAKFALTSLLLLDKRAVLALQMNGNGASVVQTSFAGANHNDPLALEAEIEAAAKDLSAVGDLRIRLNRRILNELFSQLAGARKTDLDIRLKPGRLRAEEVSAIVKVTNYTDVEGGQGRADVTQLGIDRIAGGKLNIKLSGQGELDARLRGREYGIPYSLSPHVSFAIRDQIVPMQFVTEGDRMILRAAPGTTFPIPMRISTRIAGRDIGINRTITVEADRWLNRIELPSFFGREIPMPRRLELDAGGNFYVTKKQNINFTLNNLRLSATEDALDISADVKFTAP
ncbi:MAG: hypothetical protein ACREEM_23155 [Blastocatellia bacterium]